MNSDPYHIVVLEDNLPDLLLIIQSIRGAGFGCEITTFADGAEAMAHIRDSSLAVPDLMILDFNVPKVEGASVLNNIRTNAPWAHVGGFMFSASQDPKDMARVKMLGADEYLVKPMDLEGFAQFGEFVREWLIKKRPQAKAAP